MKISNKLSNKLNKEQFESYEVIKDSLAWTAINNLAHEVIEQETNLEDVDISLSPNDYKIECSARIKAKLMIRMIFDNVSFISSKNAEEKLDLS